MNAVLKMKIGQYAIWRISFAGDPVHNMEANQKVDGLKTTWLISRWAL